jgi:hypothetical protein
MIHNTCRFFFFFFFEWREHVCHFFYVMIGTNFMTTGNVIFNKLPMFLPARLIENAYILNHIKSLRAISLSFFFFFF